MPSDENTNPYPPHRLLAKLSTELFPILYCTGADFEEPREPLLARGREASAGKPTLMARTCLEKSPRLKNIFCPRGDGPHSTRSFERVIRNAVSSGSPGARQTRARWAAMKVSIQAERHESTWSIFRRIEQAILEHRIRGPHNCEPIIVAQAFQYSTGRPNDPWSQTEFARGWRGRVIAEASTLGIEVIEATGERN